MKKKPLANLIERFNHEDLIKELYSRSTLSADEVMLLDGKVIPIYAYRTIEQFAKEYEGEFLTILYKNGKQEGYVRTAPNKQHDRFPIRSPQNIIFLVDNPPKDGTLSFKLEDYRI